MMRSVSVLALLVATAAPGELAAQGETVTQAWSLDGFDTPESALFDAQRGVIYVSNCVGDMAEKDGVGHISRVSPEGEMLEAEWVTGLHAPKGLALAGSALYVADIDRLVAINVESGEIAGEWPAEGAEFLNDATIDSEGRVFASDMLGNRIYALEGDAFSVWLENEGLQHPNGLKVDGDRIVVAPWGKGLQPDFTTEIGGHLLTVDLRSKSIAPLGGGEPIGNLDGVEPDGEGNWFVTDWVAGTLYRIEGEGAAEVLQEVPQGSADLGIITERGLAVVPMSMDGRVVAYPIR